MKHLPYFIIAFALLASCSRNKNTFDASGTFEAQEILVSSLANGQIVSFNVSEGQTLPADSVVGYIDTVQLHLQKKQIEAQIKSVLSRVPDQASQLAVLDKQLRVAQSEEQRILRLVEAKAVPQKQLDDLQHNIAVLEKQIEAQRSVLQITTNGITSSALPLFVQIELIDYGIQNSMITNPIAGTVITTYADAKEVTAMGKPLYKIANLNTLWLRAYVTGDQLAEIQLNQKVTVHTDNGAGDFNTTEGEIVWINHEAEFTPKTIQTKNERANRVYAIKVKVKNSGAYKIGMYGEIEW